MKNTIKPINEFLLVRVIKIETSKSGLVITKENQEQEQGVVISSSVKDIKKGQTIYFKSYSAIPIVVKGEELHFVPFAEILAYDTCT